MIISVVLVFLFLVFLTWRDSRKPSGFPPGPKWLPVIGCIPIFQQLLKILKFHHLVWEEFTKKYGPVVGFRLGRKLLIVVSGSEAFREFYTNDAFNGRPDGFLFRMRTFGKRLGIVFNDGKDCEVLKKFTAKMLRKLANKRNGLISHIEKETEEMISYFRELAASRIPIEMHQAFDIHTLNIVWALLAGYRFNPDDERLLHLMKILHERFRSIDMSGGILDQFPIVRFFLPEMSGYKNLAKKIKPIWKFLRENVKEIYNTQGYMQIEKSGEANSFIEAFLYKMRRYRHVFRRYSNKVEPGTPFQEEQLLSICLDLFQAGSETTSNTLSFAIIYMLNYPRVLRKVRAEILRVCGNQRLPKFSDRTNMPYTEAVIREVQRMANVAPLGIARRCLKDTIFYGYKIPKNTSIILSLYSMNKDREYWGDPETFRPERFFNENRNLAHHDLFMPFGLGKRRCIGENMAKTALFLFFATFVHVFDIVLPEGDPLPDTEGINGLTIQPKPFRVYLQRRM